MTLRDELSGLDGVTGVGLTRAARRGGSGPTSDGSPGTSSSLDDWVLRVNVASPDVDVPDSVDGVDVEVRVTGSVSASGG